MRKFSEPRAKFKRVSKAEAFCFMGRRYLHGFDGREKNYEQALIFLIKALDAGSIHAMQEIGEMYKRGYGFSKNETEAAKWYRRAAEHGEESALWTISDFLVYGTKFDVGINADEAIDLFRKLACQGNREAMYLLAKILLVCNGAEQHEAEALEWLMKYNDGNELEAMDNLGYFYFAALPDTKTNKLRALHWYKKVAASDPSYGLQIGEMYLRGRGVEQNSNTALEWFIKTAEHGNVFSMEKLAWLYLKGEFVPKDEAIALDWLTKRYKYETTAVLMLATIYYWNEDEDLPFYDETLMDKTKAFDLFQKVYESGTDADSVSWAAGYLGRMYFLGEHVARDKVKALQFWKHGVELDSGSCCNRIINLYLHGDEDEKNIPEAVNWTIKYFTTESEHFCRCGHCSPSREVRELAKFFIESDVETIIQIYGGDKSVAADAVYRFAMACVNSPLEKKQTLALVAKSGDMGSSCAEQWLLDNPNFGKDRKRFGS